MNAALEGDDVPLERKGHRITRCCTRRKPMSEWKLASAESPPRDATPIFVRLGQDDVSVLRCVWWDGNQTYPFVDPPEWVKLPK